MTDPAIIEAATRALRESTAGKAVWSGYDSVAAAIVTAVTPLIRAAVLEEAAKVIEEDRYYSFLLREEIAAAIRALKEQP